MERTRDRSSRQKKNLITCLEHIQRSPHLDESRVYSKLGPVTHAHLDSWSDEEMSSRQRAICIIGCFILLLLSFESLFGRRRWVRGLTLNI